MCDVTRDLQFKPLPFCKLPHFLRLIPPLEHEVLYARPYTFITHHSVIQRRSDLIIPRMRAAIVQSKSFAYVGPSDWTLPAPGITIPVTYPAAETAQTVLFANLSTDAVREQIANLNDAIIVI